MQGWVRTTRYLAVVSGDSGSSALFVLTTSQVPPLISTDISVEGIIPIDNNFNFDLGNFY